MYCISRVYRITAAYGPVKLIELKKKTKLKNWPQNALPRFEFFKNFKRSVIRRCKS